VRAATGDADHDEIEATGVIRRLREHQRDEHAFRIEIVSESDGTRSVNAAALTAELTTAIRRFA
jgi:intracellular sulfur oxidation DsrE/DsrF family protein